MNLDLQSPRSARSQLKSGADTSRPPPALPSDPPSAGNIHLSHIDKSIVVLGSGNTIHVERLEVSAPLPGLEGTARTATRPLLAAHQFDREKQQHALGKNLQVQIPLLLAFTGKSGQGHDWLVQFCQHNCKLGDAAQSPRLLWMREWPNAAHVDVMVDRLCERFAQAVFGRGEQNRGFTPEELLNRLQNEASLRDPKLRFVAVHEILRPGAEDRKLLDVYLERVWEPIFRRGLLGKSPILILSLHTEHKSSWFLRLLRAFGLGELAAVERIRKRISEFAVRAGARFVAPPELDSLTREELIVNYARACDTPAEELSETVDDIMATTDGDFDAVIARIYRTEAL